MKKFSTNIEQHSSKNERSENFHNEIKIDWKTLEHLTNLYLAFFMQFENTK